MKKLSSMSNKELWVEAYEQLLEELKREPNAQEIQARFEDLCSALSDEAESRLSDR